MDFMERFRAFVEKYLSYDDIVTPGTPQKRLQSLGLFLIEVYRSVVRHQTVTAASALAFKSIVALVPLIFIGIAVASMLGTSEHENYVNSFISSIESRIPDVPELKPLLGVIRSLADKAREIVGLSFIVLFYIAYTLLANIEKSFNAIWQVERKRRLLNRVVAYLAAIVVIPIMMSFSVYLNSKVEVVTLKMAKSIEETKDEAYNLIVSHMPASATNAEKEQQASQPVENKSVDDEDISDEVGQSLTVKVVLGALSLLFTSLAVGLLIIFMPYTRVKFAPALLGGLCAGVVLEVMKLGFSFYVNYASTNLTRLYGSTLLVFPLFLLWVWLVWIVILLGAEIAFNVQNYYDLVTTSQLQKKGFDYTLYLAVMVMSTVCGEFYAGHIQRGITDSLARRYAVPPLVIRNILQRFVDCGLMIEVRQEADTYSPARDIAHITVYDIYKAMDNIEFMAPEEPDSRLHRIVGGLIVDTGEQLAQRLQNVTFLDLARSESEVAADED